MEYEAEQVGEIEEGKVFRVDAPLDKQIEAFQKVGITYPFLVSLEQACNIRLAGISNSWTRTCMMPVAAEEERTILYRNSPLMNIAAAKMAIRSHNQGNYPVFSRDFYEVLKETAGQESGLEPEDRTAFVLQSNEDYDLTPEMDDTKFILGNVAKPYFEKFKHSSIRFFNLSAQGTPKDKCLVNYLWFSGPASGSGLYARSRGLNGDGGGDSWAFGVLRKSAEGASQNSYSITNVRDAIRASNPQVLDAIGLPAIKDIVLSPLEKGVLKALREYR